MFSARQGFNITILCIELVGLISVTIQMVNLSLVWAAFLPVLKLLSLHRHIFFLGLHQQN